MNVNIFLAFSAGLLSFLSPCILPLIPAYLVWITGLTAKELEFINKKNFLKIFTRSLFFILGFSLIFIVFAILINYFGRYIPRRFLSFIGGIIIIFFGLHLIGIIKIKPIYNTKQLKISNKLYLSSSFLMGIIFAVGWSPCIGPILGSILMYASVQETIARAVLLLFIYCMGLGIPFLIISILGVGLFVKFLDRVKKYFRLIQLTSGLFLIFIGFLILFDKFWL